MFQQIIGSRGIGKTKALIELASKNNTNISEIKILIYDFFLLSSKN